MGEEGEAGETGDAGGVAPAAVLSRLPGGLTDPEVATEQATS